MIGCGIDRDSESSRNFSSSRVVESVFYDIYTKGEEAADSVKVSAGDISEYDRILVGYPHLAEYSPYEYWQQNQKFDMILVTEDGKIYLTEGIEECFSANENRKVHVINYEK